MNDGVVATLDAIPDQSAGNGDDQGLIISGHWLGGGECHLPDHV